jgi:hypothetical protein
MFERGAIETSHEESVPPPRVGLANTGCAGLITDAYPAWAIIHLEEDARWRLQDRFATG